MRPTTTCVSFSFRFLLRSFVLLHSFRWRLMFIFHHPISHDGTLFSFNSFLRVRVGCLFFRFSPCSSLSFPSSPLFTMERFIIRNVCHRKRIHHITLAKRMKGCSTSCGCRSGATCPGRSTSSRGSSHSSSSSPSSPRPPRLAARPRLSSVR